MTKLIDPAEVKAMQEKLKQNIAELDAKQMADRIRETQEYQELIADIGNVANLINNKLNN